MDHSRCRAMQAMFFNENDVLRNRVAEMEAKNAEYQDLIDGLKQTIQEKDAKIKQLEETIEEMNKNKQPIKKQIQKKKKTTKK